MKSYGIVFLYHCWRKQTKVLFTTFRNGLCTVLKPKCRGKSIIRKKCVSLGPEVEKDFLKKYRVHKRTLTS